MAVNLVVDDQSSEDRNDSLCLCISRLLMSDSENNNFNVKMRPTWNPVIFSVCILAGILAIYLVIHISIRLSSTTKIYKIFNVSYVPSPDCDSIPIDNIIMDPKQILKMEHERIIYELANYNSTGNAIELSALTPETNVRPLQSGKFTSHLQFYAKTRFNFVLEFL